MANDSPLRHDWPWWGPVYVVCGLSVMHGVVPYGLSRLAVRHGWEAGHPAEGNLLGLLPIAAGLALIAWTIVLHVRQAVRKGWRMERTPFEPPQYLLVTGPYRYTRNPIYIAHIAIWSGWALFYGSLAVAAGVVVIWASLAFVIVPYEERGLVRQLGEPYERYREQVPRWFGRSAPGSGVQPRSGWVEQRIGTTSSLSALAAPSDQSCPEPGRRGERAIEKTPAAGPREDLSCMTLVAICLLTLWAAWLRTWLIAARSAAATVSRQSRAARLAHGAPMWAGAVLLFFQPRRFGLYPVLPQTLWLAWLGTVVVALGLGFAIWARLHLGRYWSGAVTLKAEHTLIRSGPYAWSRHPIYSGLLTAFIGTAIARGTTAALAGLLLVLFGVLLKIRQEERLLVTHFGTAYRDYRQQVPALIPRWRLGDEQRRSRRPDTGRGPCGPGSA